MVTTQTEHRIGTQPGGNNFGFRPWNFVAFSQNAEVALQGFGDGLFDSDRHRVGRLGRNANGQPQQGQNGDTP